MARITIDGRRPGKLVVVLGKGVHGNPRRQVFESNLELGTVRSARLLLEESLVPALDRLDNASALVNKLAVEGE